MSQYLYIPFVIIALFYLPSCNEAQEKKEENQSPKVNQVIIQFPSENDIMTAPLKSTFSKKAVTIVSFEKSVMIKDEDKAVTGYSLWNMANSPPDQDYKIRLKIKKGYDSNQYTMIQIKFISGKQALGKYDYLVMPRTGKVIPRQQATKEMISVVADGEKWVFEFKARSPKKSSTMQFFLMPAVGKKVTTGFVDIEEIKISSIARSDR